LTAWGTSSTVTTVLNRFGRIPTAVLRKLSRYQAVLSPNFIMYLKIAPVVQRYNVFRNRWCGVCWDRKDQKEWFMAGNSEMQRSADFLLDCMYHA